MSDLQGRRIPGEEGSGRRRPWIWIVLGLILLALLVLLIPFACQNLAGNGSGRGGSGAQGGAEQNAGDGADEGAKGANGGAQGDVEQNGGTGAGGAEDGTGSGGSRGEVASARLEARDQSGSGEAVVVPAATVEGAKGWLAVRADGGGGPGRVLGYAPLRDGTNRDVRVELDRPVGSSQRLYATVHAEAPADGDFTYPDGDPTVEQDGRAVIEPISYTVQDAATDDGAGDDAASDGRAADGIRDDRLPESGGPSPVALLAGGLLLLLVASAWGLRRAFR